MQLRFGPDDFESFTEVKDQLIEELEPLVANDEWAAQDPVDRARSVVLGLLEAGPLRSRVARWSDLDEAHRDLLDDGIPHWFSRLLIKGAHVDDHDIEELALEVSEMRLPDWDE